VNGVVVQEVPKDMKGRSILKQIKVFGLGGQGVVTAAKVYAEEDEPVVGRAVPL
jgi:hypothetical protein